MPLDRNGYRQGYAFVTFKHECSVNYAIELFEDTTLYGRIPKLRSRRGPTHQRSQSAPVNFPQNSAKVEMGGISKAQHSSLMMGHPIRMPASVAMPMGAVMGMPMPMGAGLPMGMGMPIGGLPMGGNMPMGGGMPMGMPIGMSPPLPFTLPGVPGEMMPPPNQPSNDQSGRGDFNNRNLERNSLSQSSLQGNWSNRNSSHMLPADNRSRRNYQDRDSSRGSSNHRTSSYDRGGSRQERDRYHDRDGYYSRDRDWEGRDNRDRHRDRSYDSYERRGRY